MMSAIDRVELGVGAELGVGVGLSVGFAVAPGPELPQPDTILMMTTAATSGSFDAEPAATIKRFISTLRGRTKTAADADC